MAPALPQKTAQPEQPNIILICTDQHTASALSCAGNTDVKTPNIDRLAAAGVRFTNAYCTSPLSGPARSAMFTGYYPESIGMAVNGAPLPDSLKTQTLGSIVKRAGYDCVYAGKWHVPQTAIPDSIYGFRQIHGHNDVGLAEACVSFLDGCGKPFFLVASYDNPHNICEYARQQNLPYGNVDEPDLRDCPGLPANFAKNPYDAGIIEEERAANYQIYPTARYSADDWRRYRYTYYRLVEKVDAEIGKIVDAIDRNKLWENTVVIFTSDHGDGVGAHGWNQKSALYEEVVNIPLIVCLPGKKNAGTTLPQLVSNSIDLFASIVDWSGAELSADGLKTNKVSDYYSDGMRGGKGAEHGADGVKRDKGSTCSHEAVKSEKNIDYNDDKSSYNTLAPRPGKSFRSVAESGDAAMPHQEVVITETRFDNSTTRGWMVRTPRYKYVLYDKGRYREQLFDIDSDRGESRNLAVENAYADILQQHRDLLASWMNSNKIRPTRPAIHDVPGKEKRK